MSHARHGTWVALGVSPDLIKAATADTATDDDRAALQADTLKALGVDVDAIVDTITTAITADLAAAADLAKGLSGLDVPQLGEMAAFERRLDLVQRAVAPAPPIRKAGPRQSRAVTRSAEIVRMRRVADEINDQSAREGYLKKVAALEDEERSVANAQMIVDREGRR